MKILIITQYFWPESFKINDLALSLKERGFEVTVLTGKPNYPSGRFYTGYNFFNRRAEDYSGIKVVRSPLITRGNCSGFRLFLNYISFALFSSLSAAFRVQKSQDIVFVYEPSPITVGIPALVFKLFSNAPIMFWIQDLWPESLIAAGNMNSKIVLNTTEKLVKLIYKKSEYLFISSRSFEQSVINKGVQKDKILYLPNWAEDIYTTSVSGNEAVLRSLPGGGFKIMFAGNIGEAQDFESIVNAAEQTQEFDDIQWIVLGDGRKKKWVEQQIYQRKLHNIFLIGRRPMTEMPAYFKEADVMLVALKDELIFSLTVPAKIQSYLACGKPILAMMNGEGADIVKESNSGFAVNAGDFRSLAEKAIELYKMPKNVLNSMANSSKEYYIKNFDKRELIDELISIFQSVIKNKQN